MVNRWYIDLYHGNVIHSLLHEAVPWYTSKNEWIYLLNVLKVPHIYHTSYIKINMVHAIMIPWYSQRTVKVCFFIETHPRKMTWQCKPTAPHKPNRHPLPFASEKPVSQLELGDPPRPKLPSRVIACQTAFTSPKHTDCPRPSLTFEPQVGVRI